MNSMRKKVTEFIVSVIQDFTPGDTRNSEITRERLESMSDEKFEDYMRRLGKPQTEEEWMNREHLNLYVPNLDKTKINVIRNVEIAKSLGKNIFQQVWITDPQTLLTFLTPKPYPVMDLPVRRQAQIHEKKASIPLHSKSVDQLTGQVTGDSKGSKMSFPEIGALASQKLDNSLIEMIKIRGGDEEAYREVERKLIQTGSCSMSDVLDMGTRVKSTDVASAYLKAMHLDNNL